MAEGRIESMDRVMWRHTDALMVKLHNVNCSKTSDMLKPGHFDPYANRTKPKPEELTPETLAMVKRAYKRGGKRGGKS